MHKSLISLLLLAAMVLSLAACAAKEPNNVTSAPTQDDTVPHTTGVMPSETTEPTEEIVYVTLPPISTPTEPVETQPVESTPVETQPGTEPTGGAQLEAPKPTSYEAYNAMSAEEQAAFYNSFADPNAFFAWINAAKKEYEDSLNQTIVDGNTNIDMGGN